MADMAKLGRALHVHLFVSRNKDNKDVSGFKQRRKTILARNCQLEMLCNEWEAFLRQGKKGEFCRWYMSVNARDEDAVRRAVTHRLVDGADIAKIDAIVASEAAKASCAAEHCWMFDFDNEDMALVKKFAEDIAEPLQDGYIDINPSPHGFHVIVSHGFDTRDLLEKWGDTVTLKRDDLFCHDWAVC